MHFFLHFLRIITKIFLVETYVKRQSNEMHYKFLFLHFLFECAIFIKHTDWILKNLSETVKTCLYHEVCKLIKNWTSNLPEIIFLLTNIKANENLNAHNSLES